MRLPAVAALVLVLASSVQANADWVPGLFQGNPWGMSLAEMKKRYPGGYLLKRQASGELPYEVVLEVADRKNAIVILGFNRANLFQRAFLMFPKAGTPVNLKTNTWTPETPEEMGATLATLRKMLQGQYGHPGPVDDPTKGTLWTFPNGSIFLYSNAGAVNVIYTAPEAVAPSGL